MPIELAITDETPEAQPQQLTESEILDCFRDIAPTGCNSYLVAVGRAIEAKVREQINATAVTV